MVLVVDDVVVGAVEVVVVVWAPAGDDAPISSATARPAGHAM
jgi:hypothetical protein